MAAVGDAYLELRFYFEGVAVDAGLAVRWGELGLAGRRHRCRQRSWGGFAGIRRKVMGGSTTNSTGLA
jgi:hypothetical protein